MTVREMINELSGFDDNMQVVIKGSMTDYVDWTYDQYSDGIAQRKIRTHFGNDREAVVIFGEDQAGMI